LPGATRYPRTTRPWHRCAGPLSPVTWTLPPIPFVPTQMPASSITGARYRWCADRDGSRSPTPPPSTSASVRSRQRHTSTPPCSTPPACEALRAARPAAPTHPLPGTRHRVKPQKAISKPPPHRRGRRSELKPIYWPQLERGEGLCSCRKLDTKSKNFPTQGDYGGHRMLVPPTGHSSPCFESGGPEGSTLLPLERDSQG
jgi:hypothetical protein